MAALREDPRWSPLQRRIYRMIAIPLWGIVALLLIGGLVLFWIGLRNGWFLAQPK